MINCCMAMGMTLQAGLLLMVRMPGVKDKEVSEVVMRLPWSEVLCEGRGEAMALSTVCYSVMVSVMTPTPLVMQEDGHSYGAATIVIQCHVISMFAPSFFTGELIGKLGTHPVVYSGCVLLVLAFSVMHIGTGYGHYIVALSLLGDSFSFH